MNRFLLILITGFLLNSCAGYLFGYRGAKKTEYTIANNSNDTEVRQKIGKLIYNLSNEEKFYSRFASPTYDSLYFYGPDYHHFRFKIYEENKVIKVYLDYFGYNGSRNHPPHEKFMQLISDSLKTSFGATQKILEDRSNKKTKVQNHITLNNNIAGNSQSSSHFETQISNSYKLSNKYSNKNKTVPSFTSRPFFD